MRITFVRHGQSEANAARVWQGHGSTPLTREGRAQAKALGARLAGRHFDLVLSSDLERAADTARIAGYEPEQSIAWREGDIGGWDGLTEAQVLERFPEEIARLRAGEDIAFGATGETLAEVRERARRAVERLIERLGPDDQALVVSHGGIIGAAVRDVLGLPVTGRYMGLQMNTAITDVEVQADGTMRLLRYADAGHLGPWVGFAARMHREGAVVIDLIRHAVTDANVAGRVQGQLDWGLNDEGRHQAARLASWIGQVDEVYTSPLGRAAETASLAFGPDHRPAHLEGLMEIDMGEWEGRNWEELRSSDPLLQDLWDVDEHFQRGMTGETYAQLRERATATMHGLANGGGGPKRIAAVSHGGTIGAYLRTLLGLDGARRHRLGRLANTAVSRVAYLKEGPLLVDFNVSYHLE